LRAVPSIPSPDPPLTDGEVVLRVLGPQDVADFYRGVADPSVAPYWSRSFADETEALAYIEEYVPERMAEGSGIVLAVLGAPDGGFLGITMLFAADWHNLSVGIGWWLVPEARGRGGATAAVRIFCDWVFDTVGLERIQADIDLDNLASQRLAERIGFTREGIRRGLFRDGDARADLYCYGLLATDRAR
jgi:[ribosomal protein S5]-alanine N-acetyltransferase